MSWPTVNALGRMIQFLADCCNQVRDVYQSRYREHIKWKADVRGPTGQIRRY